MSFTRALSVLPRWLLALVLGLGPLGAEVLADLGHAQVCACCEPGDADSCCGEGAEEPEAPRLVPPEGCPCASVAPSSETCALVRRASESRAGARAELERWHRAVELAWVALPQAASCESSPSPPGCASAAGPPGASSMRGSGRASALGVLRL